MMSQAQYNSDKTLLATRLINHLPFVSSVRGYYPSVKEFYTNTKIANPILEAGLNYAEGTVASTYAPLLSRYEKIDAFAAVQLEKLGEAYEEGKKEGLPSLARKGAINSVRAVAYPVGFGLELAHHARGLAAELATPAISRAYDMIDDVIDNLLPADADEAEYEDVSGLSPLQRKSPVRRLRKRINVNNVVHLPATSFHLSRALALDLSYRGIIVGKVLRDQFAFNLDRSLQALAGLEEIVLARPLGYAIEGLHQARRSASENGEALVQNILINALHRADDLKSKLDDAKLPKSAHLVDRVSNDLQNLASFFGIHLVEKEEPHTAKHSSHRPARRLFPSRHPKLHDFSQAPAHVSHYLGDQRMPTFYSGSDALAHVGQREEARMPHMVSGQGERQAVVQARQGDRTFSMMTGEHAEAAPHHVHVVSENDRLATMMNGDNAVVPADHDNTSASHEHSNHNESESNSEAGEEVRAELDRHSELSVKPALPSHIRHLAVSKTIPPTPVNSPVPPTVTATPNMPIIVITDNKEEAKKAEANGHFPMPHIKHNKNHKKIKGDKNPFDALNDAAGEEGMALDTPHHHETLGGKKSSHDHHKTSFHHAKHPHHEAEQVAEPGQASI